MLSKLSRIWARLPTYLTYIRERPSWLLVLIFGRFLVARRLERALFASVVNQEVTEDGIAVSASDRAAIGGKLAKDGVYVGLNLAASITAEIRRFALKTKCTTRVSPIVEFLPSDIADVNRLRATDVIAGYYFQRVDECRAIREVESDPLINKIAANYIGAKCQHIRTRLWWSFPGDRTTEADLHAAAQNKYHFDLNDFRTLKFFFYLTDVTETTGPHSYIRGSHVKRKLNHQFTAMVGHGEDSLRAAYAAEDFATVTGRAGTGFVEDPFVFHYGKLCQSARRLILEIEFGPYVMSSSYRYGLLG